MTKIGAILGSEAQSPLRIAVLGGATLATLQQHWRRELSDLLPGRTIETYQLPFGQLRPAMLDPASDLRQFAPDVRVFCDRIEDIVGTLDQDETTVVDRVREHAEAIAGFHHAAGGWSILHRFALLSVSPDAAEQRRQAGLIARLNDLLDEILSPLPQIAWVDLAAEAAGHDGPVRDARFWHVGRFPFADGFGRKLAKRWAGLVLAMTGETARLVVVDLDNTLWGGVLGEDGLAGIKIGGDYPGNSFAAFQRALKALAGRGVALAISSKNDADLALQALSDLPAMVLRPGDFAGHRINWRPKWESIAALAAELNLGLGSVLFIDDNPVEREAVKLNLPEVKVLDLPKEPALYADALLASPYLASVVTTAEDLRRLDSFKAQSQRTAARTGAASLEDYYASLGTILHLAPLSTGTAERAVQLCQKTNQFNTTQRRYDRHDLERLVAEGADVVVIGLEDRHAPLENIGLLILKPDGQGGGIVDLYLLSCRVLGRGIETILPRWATAHAAARGWAHLTGEIIESDRNTPARQVFAEAGYQLAGPGRWSIQTGEHTEPLPAYVTIEEAL